MDYLVAQDLIRSEHLDLVREGGLNGFKPFETTCGAANEPLIRLSPAEPLTLDDFAGYRELDRFDFDEAVADCHFGRYDGGRLFYMTAPGQRPVLFAKADGDPLVQSNVAADGRPDPSLLRFGLWMSFGIAHNPHSIAIHSSVIVHSGRAVLFLGESGTGKEHPYAPVARTHSRCATAQRRLADRARRRRRATVFGSPWSGKTPCYRNESYPIAAFVRLAQAPHNRIARLPVVRAIGALLPSCPPAFAYDAQLQDNICDTLSTDRPRAGLPVGVPARRRRRTALVRNDDRRPMKRTVPNRMLFAETRDQLLAGREVVVRVLGQSMLPFFRSGSRITLRPLREGDLRRGHVVLGETDNGHFVVHRILTVCDERVTPLGDGNTVRDRDDTRERIYGIVDCGRLHLWLAERWMRLRPLRRYPLAILRRICRK